MNAPVRAVKHRDTWSLTDDLDSPFVPTAAEMSYTAKQAIEREEAVDAFSGILHALFFSAWFLMAGIAAGALIFGGLF